MLAANEVLGVKVLAANEVSDVESSNGLKRVKPKTGRSESQKLVKSQKSKKPSKNGNSPNFDATEAGPSILTPKARTVFNRLQLTFTEASILWHFDPKCHIWIETDASGYANGSVLSQLVSETRPDGVFTKTNLGQWHSVAFLSRKIISVKT